MIKIVLTNFPVELAKEAARKIVNSKLAGCVNLVPKIESVYEWEGKIVEEAESMLLIKSTESKLDDLFAFIKKIHPYQVPEIAVIEPVSINAEYLQWLKAYVEEN